MIIMSLNFYKLNKLKKILNNILFFLLLLLLYRKQMKKILYKQMYNKLNVFFHEYLIPLYILYRFQKKLIKKLSFLFIYVLLILLTYNNVLFLGTFHLDLFLLYLHINTPYLYLKF